MTEPATTSPDAATPVATPARPDDAARQLLRNARALAAARKDGGTHPHQRGMALLAAGRAADAVLAFREAVDAMPDAPWPQVGLGDALWSVGDTAGAASAYAAALDRTPAGASALLGSLGASFERAGDHERAVIAYRRATAADPTSTAFGLGLARALRATASRRLDEAAGVLAGLDLATDDLALVEEVLEHAPRHPALLQRYARSLARAGAHERALTMLELAVAQAPDDLDALALLGELLAAGHGSRAQRGVVVELIDRLARRGVADVRLLVARARFLDGDEPGIAAIRGWSDVVEAEPQRAEWHKELGDRLAEAGRFEEAGEAYDRAISLGFEPA